ncbi:MAG: TonB-dependent receptor [Marinilabiliales bacterium]|nr:MAG: TonB-dependent receptor [Marinilabiliales bacterium]
MNKLTIFIILFIFWPFLIYSQVGQIKGRVFNEVNNEALPFSNIFIEGTDYGASSDFDGNFIISGLKPGIYRLTASSLGFDTKITEEVQVSPGKTVTLDISMRESALTLNEVTVEAQMFEKNEEAPVSLRSIGLSEIENSPGANRDISKVIQNLPGVAAIPGQNRNDVIVRGGASNESKFYLDDVEIPNINHFATQGASGGTNGILNADFIRNVDFYSGAFPANRGNALSGVFNFKQIDGNQEDLRFRGSLGASEVSLTMDGPISDNTTYILSARRSYLNFLFQLIGLPFLPTFNDFQFKVKTKLDDRSELTFIGLGAYDVNVLDRNIENPTEFQSYILGYLSESEQWTYTLGTVYKKFRDNGYTTYVLSRNMLNNRYYKYIDNVVDEDNLLNNYSSFEAENKFRVEDYIKTESNYRINYGINFEYARYYNNTMLNVFTPFGQQEISFDSNLDMFKYGAFGQVSKAYLGNRLTLSLGIRFDGNEYSSSMSNPLEQFSPRFSASYDLSEKWSINMNTGRYYLLPSYTSLGYRDSNGTLVNKNNDIKYIQSDHLIGGFAYRPTGRSIITIEGFYKMYDRYPFSVNDSLVLAFKPVDFGVVGSEEITSIGEGHAYGFEVFSQNRFKNDFNLSLSYTFAVSEFKDTEGEYVSTSWDNRHILIITGTKKFKNDWFVGVKWRFAGGLPYTPYDLEVSSSILAWDLNGRPYFDYSQLNQLRFGAFHQLDFRVDKTFYFENASLKFYIDIQNAYNFKSDAQDIYVNTDTDGNVQINPDDPSEYILRKIPNDGSGTVVPTLGIIVDF